MATQNLIQIKRSEAVAEPSSLAAGELAWSGNTDALFIGNFGTVTQIGGTVINSNTMTGATATNLASASSIKAYVDSQLGTVVSTFDINGDGSTSDTFSTGETLTFAGQTGITVSVGNNSVAVDLDDTAVSTGSYGDANSVATFTVDQQGRLTAAGTTDINHDSLLNFVSNEHIDHSTVSISSGNGLSGGGNITASRTLSVNAGGGLVANSTGVHVGASDGITVNADNIAVDAGGGLLANSSGVHVGAGAGVTVNADDIAVNVSGDSSLVANSSGLFVVDSTLSITSGQVSGLATSATTDTTNASNITSGTLASARLPDLTVADFGGAAVQTGSEVGNTGTSIADNDTSLLTAAAVINYVEGKNYSTTTGTVTSVDSGDGLTGGAITGSGTLSVNAQGGLVANSTGLHADVTLGTHTSGNYVATVSGTANEISVTGSGSESATVTIGLPDDVTITNNLTVSNDLSVAGDLTVTGNVVSIEVQDLKVDDSLIHLASNNFANILDIGFVGHYSTDGGTTVLHNGLVWDASESKFILFDSLVQDGLDNGDTTIDTANATFSLSTLSAGALTLDTDLAVEHGGTGASSFTDNGIIYGNGSSALSVTAAGTQYQVLQAGSGGVPEWGSLDGGTF